MKYINLNFIFVLLISFLLIILNLNFISSLGVVSPYSGSELFLEMYPGEKKIVMLELQNWDINEEIFVEGRILNGEDIASLKDEKISVPYQVRIPVEMIIKLPRGADIGDKYNIKYEFKQVGEEREGMVSFNQGIKRNFDVVVIEKPEGEKSFEFSWIFIILLIILIIIIVWIIWRVKKKKV